MTPEEQSAWTELLLQQQLGDYMPTRFINAGQFGMVFEADHLTGQEAVALKVLIPGATADALNEFDTEGRLLARLKRSSSVVDHRETGVGSVEVSGPGGVKVPLPLHFHALELASGCLEELVGDEGPRSRLPWEERLRLWRGVVLGIHQMHLKGIAHRDLKTSNCLLLVYRRQVTMCKVGDLGRARDLSVPARGPADWYVAGRGDLRFAPPEFLWLQGAESAQAHKAADLYGLGSLLFELATGVGITQMALGFGPEIVRAAVRDAQAGLSVDLAALRGRYQGALELFADELPPVIRDPATSLLRQLCDPQPALRFPRSAPGRRVPRSDGLEWLLRSADILIHRLAVAPVQKRSTKAVS